MCTLLAFRSHTFYTHRPAIRRGAIYHERLTVVRRRRTEQQASWTQRCHGNLFPIWTAPCLSASIELVEDGDGWIAPTMGSGCCCCCWELLLWLSWTEALCRMVKILDTWPKRLRVQANLDSSNNLPTPEVTSLGESRLRKLATYSRGCGFRRISTQAKPNLLQRLRIQANLDSEDKQPTPEVAGSGESRLKQQKPTPEVAGSSTYRLRQQLSHFRGCGFRRISTLATNNLLPSILSLVEVGSVSNPSYAMNKIVVDRVARLCCHWLSPWKAAWIPASHKVHKTRYCVEFGAASSNAKKNTKANANRKTCLDESLSAVSSLQYRNNCGQR